MSQLTTQQTAESLDGLMNANREENKKHSSELIEREPIFGTPFTLINYDTKGWFLTMGKFRLTNENDFTREELLQIVENKDWNLIMQVIGNIVNFEIENNKNETK